MKKLVCTLISVFIIGQSIFAQTADKKVAPKAAPTTTQTTKVEEKKDKKEEGVKPAKMKKNGTPDMRYKENKEAAKAKPAGPLKKDGTPDMRHKANKEATKKK